MSPELPELPSTHVRPAPAEQPVILDAAAIDHAPPPHHSAQEVRAINAVFTETSNEVAGAMFALWGAGVILDGMIEDARGEHGPGEPKEAEKPKPEPEPERP